MRIRTIITGLTVATSLALSGCSKSSPAGSAAIVTPAGQPKSGAAAASTPLSSAMLAGRLLTAADLGPDYTLKPETTSRHDDVTVIGCPAMEQLGGDAVAGGTLDFPNKAKATFAYSGGKGSEVSEELYSDTAPKLSAGTARIFDAMTSCPVYQMVIGSRPVKITTQKLAAPALGEQAWSQMLTFTAGGQDTIIKQTAVRIGSVLLIVSGSPALVDSHAEKALSKASPAR
ncbi:hypothetical protein ACGFYY_38435 [Streptomyces sp. NPDC048331]|uniref:hypothetical protein n=1 Tax=Streptomyces sp. NPDC048331 TaxID=3365534 RepID=UPI00371850EB